MNITITKISDTIESKQKAVGVVTWWNDAKGYGFINHEGQELFAHYSAIVTDGFRTLTEGETVLITVVQGPKGPQAFDIVRGGK